MEESNQGVASNNFLDTLNGYRTYVSAVTGIIFNALVAFRVWSPTDQQVASINGIIVLLTAIFLRIGIKKAAQLSAKRSDA